MKNTVLITGASSGFGKVTAKLFHTNGWNVIATMRSPEKETELAALSGILITKLDFTDIASTKLNGSMHKISTSIRKD
jgi:NADP-dependent 3-hydroxy acid dehydrogenase YdfG